MARPCYTYPDPHIELRDSCPLCQLDDPSSKRFSIGHHRFWNHDNAYDPSCPICKELKHGATSKPCSTCGPGVRLKNQPADVQPKPRSLILSDPVRTISAGLPKILLCSQNLDLTGAPTIMANLAPALRGFEIDVFSWHDGELRKRFESSGFAVKIGSLPDVRDYSLVVANTLVSSPAVEAAIDAGVPVVWMIHEANPRMCKEPYFDDMKRLIGRADRVVFPGPATQAAYREWRPESDLIETVIPRVPKIDRGDARTRLGISDRFVIVCLGSIERRKGQRDLVEAIRGSMFDRAAIMRSECKVFIVGTPYDPEEVEGRGLNVEIIPATDGRFDYLAAADLAVHCSRLESNVPLAIQEEKAFGLPVVCTRVEGIDSLVPDGVCGLHYEAGNVADLRTKIERLMNDADERRRLSKSIPQDFGAYVGRLEAVFREAISPPSDSINVVYHVASLGDHWKQIVTEQLDQIGSAGLNRILLTHCGDGLEWVISECERRKIDASVRFHSPDVRVYEQPAMRLVERLAHASDKPIVYLHTKGVSHPLSETQWHDWRRVMMREVVIEWRRNLKTLRSGRQAVGVNWWKAIPRQEHFSGNFWMVSAEWIRNLLPFDDYLKWYLRVEDTGIGGPRYACERWIGSIPGCRVESLLCHDVKFHIADNLYRVLNK